MQRKSGGSVPGDDLADEMYRFVLIDTDKGQLILDRHYGMAKQFVGYPVYDRKQLEHSSKIGSPVDRHELINNMAIYRGKNRDNLQVTSIQKIWEFGAEGDGVDYARILSVEPYPIDNDNLLVQVLLDSIYDTLLPPDEIFLIPAHKAPASSPQGADMMYA